MHPIQNVLIGTTLSEASDDLVSAGVRFANALGAKVHLLHALELPPLTYGGAPYAGVPPFDLEELSAELTLRMEQQIDRLHLGAVRRHVVIEPAHRALIDVAKEVAAGLIVVGAADTALARLLGSTAGRVVRKSRCPVLVLRGPLPLPPPRILLPIDFSPIAGEVAVRGFEILAQLAQMAAGMTVPSWRESVEVEAFHCVVPVGYESWVPLFDPEEVKRKAVEELDRLCAPRAGAGWKVWRHAGLGGAREEILRRIAEWHPDLVIMGTHGAAGFERFLVGSVAGSVLERCGTNVLVIPPLAAQAAEVEVEALAAEAPPPVAVATAQTPAAALV